MAQDKQSIGEQFTSGLSEEVEKFQNKSLFGKAWTVLRFGRKLLTRSFWVGSLSLAADTAISFVSAGGYMVYFGAALWLGRNAWRSFRQPADADWSDEMAGLGLLLLAIGAVAVGYYHYTGDIDWSAWARRIIDAWLGSGAEA
ncbi:MAG: hypothetical protein MRY63_11490 [Neomegalonema sp.]|nr:hypothetical protein [Neomegalonema sp.]